MIFCIPVVGFFPLVPPYHSSGFSSCSVSQEADLKGLWQSVSLPLAFCRAQPTGVPGGKLEDTGKASWTRSLGSHPLVGGMAVSDPSSTGQTSLPSCIGLIPLQASPPFVVSALGVVGRLRNAYLTLLGWFPLPSPPFVSSLELSLIISLECAICFLPELCLIQFPRAKSDENSENK